MIFLVALRVVIGWHFLSEGLAKLSDPNGFQSAGFLSQAVGPYADFFHDMVPDVHDWRKTVDTAAVQWDSLSDQEKKKETPPYIKWGDSVASSWEKLTERISDYSVLSEEQRKEAEQILAARKNQLQEYLKSNEEDLDAYLHELSRLADWRADPGAESIPFKRERIAGKSRELKGEAATWKNWVLQVEDELRTGILSLAETEEQQKLARAYSPPMTAAGAMDRFIAYSHVAIGACLMAGFLTRLASLGGAGFLVMVVMTNLPWVAGAAPTYYQLIELTALLTLATTAVGRWGGLDFFVHYCLIRPCCTAKGGE